MNYDSLSEFQLAQIFYLPFHRLASIEIVSANDLVKKRVIMPKDGSSSTGMFHFVENFSRITDSVVA